MTDDKTLNEQLPPLGELQEGDTFDVGDRRGSIVGSGQLADGANFEVFVLDAPEGEPTRQSLFGVEIDAMRMSQAVERVLQWLDDPEDDRCRFVVTPNVDHVVQLQHNAALRDVYQDADLVLADGHPVVWASWLLGRPVPERVTGSDLVPHLFDAATPEQPMTTYLLGAAPGVAERAANAIRSRWPSVEVVGTYSPPLGFEDDDAENEAILQRLHDAKPQVLVVGLGAPKQELWVHLFHRHLPVRAALCVGATIDFLAGERKRAPRWMQKAGVEWLHRLASEPRRLAKRYAKDAWVFPQVVWREWRRSDV